MATVHITLARTRRRMTSQSSWDGLTLPVADSVPIAAATASSSGVSTASAIAAPDVNAFWSVTATGGNVFVQFGGAPIAASGQGWLILDGQTRDFGVSAIGEKIAVKDA